LETPRSRFRAFLDAGDRRWIAPALAGSGLAYMSSQIVLAFTEQRAKVAEVPAQVWYGLLAFWPLFTILCGWLNALFLRFTGRFLGGQASVRDLVAALGWSAMPVALGSPLVAAEAVALIRGAAAPEEAGGLSQTAGLVVSFFFGMTAVMAVVRAIIAISEAQRLSKWRAFANVALALVPAFAVGLMVLVLGGGLRF
jgi:Yip1-like protein